MPSRRGRGLRFSTSFSPGSKARATSWMPFVTRLSQRSWAGKKGDLEAEEDARQDRHDLADAGGDEEKGDEANVVEDDASLLDAGEDAREVVVRRDDVRCLLCDLVAAERKDGRRLIFEEDGFVAYAPFAAAAPYETLLVPLEHRAALTAASPATERGLATSLQSLLTKLDLTLDEPPFNLIVRTAPKPWLTDAALHWYVQLVPRLSLTAGFELGSGVRINTVAPETAARTLVAG